MKVHLIILILFSSFLFGQNSSFIYDLKYKPNSDSTKTEKVTYYLDVREKESLFRSNKFRRSDSLRVKRGTPEGYDTQFNNRQLYVKKNFTSNETKRYVFVPIVYKTYAIDITDQLDWKISDEKQMIGSYNCQKAEVSYGGRSWQAWFTTDIAISDGPYIFKGLPGLIVKINDEKSDFQFNLVQVKNFNWKELYPAKIEKMIAWSDYEKLQSDFYSDPISAIKPSAIINYDEAGNIVKTDLREMREMMKKHIRAQNNPIELNHKVEYK